MKAPRRGLPREGVGTVEADPGVFERWVQGLTERALADLADGPHIVVARDPDDGSTYFTGPYPTALAALTAADGAARRQEETPDQVQLEISVAPIVEP